MPKTLFQEIVFTFLMATLMVYGLVVYNIALSQGGLTNATFLLAFRELVIMMPIAFVLEFFVVGKIAPKLAFTVVDPRNTKPQFITYAISLCIVCIMCPVMSLIAMFIFNLETASFAKWIELWVFNFPMALCWQMFYCGPFVRLVFRSLFRVKQEAPTMQQTELA